VSSEDDALHADWNPPTVADTKRKFYEAFRRPVAGIYNTVIQELLVQQHIMRYNRAYSYDAVRLFRLSGHICACSRPALLSACRMLPEEGDTGMHAP
jgi:hypothetical protein